MCLLIQQAVFTVYCFSPIVAMNSHISSILNGLQLHFSDPGFSFSSIPGMSLLKTNAPSVLQRQSTNEENKEVVNSSLPAATQETGCNQKQLTMDGTNTDTFASGDRDNANDDSHLLLGSQDLFRSKFFPAVSKRDYLILQPLQMRDSDMKTEPFLTSGFAHQRF